MTSRQEKDDVNQEVEDEEEQEQLEKKAKKKYKKGWKIFFYVLVALLIVTFIIVTSVIFAYYANVYNSSAPIPVSQVDLFKFVGVWYEIARLPTPTENGCFNTVSTYVLRPSGTIEATQLCVSGGVVYSSTGTLAPNAPVIITPTEALVKPGVFSLSFPFYYGNYLVLDLDPSYQWAMYGSRDRSTLKILSRQKTLDPSIYQSLVEKARSFNYKTQYLIQVVQV